MSTIRDSQTVGVCSNFANHTSGPLDYAAWHEWAERMSQTHQQRRCEGCGRWAVWVELSKNTGQLVDAAGEVW